MVQVHSSFDGRLVGEVPDQSASEVASVVAALREAQTGWELAGVDARVRWMRAYRDWLLDNTDRLNKILQSETGKPWAEANLELPSIIDQLNFYGPAGQRLGLRTLRGRLLPRRPACRVGGPAARVNINDVFTNLFTAPLPMSGWK